VRVRAQVMNSSTNRSSDSVNALFARLRRTPLLRRNEPESSLLKCPRCGNRLKPLLLDTFEERGENYQRVWWVCRSLKSKTCIFPLNMPPEVFWTKRTEEQIRHNVIPLPNYNLLPQELKDLYPFLTKNKVMVPRLRPSTSKNTFQRSKGSENISNISTKERVDNGDIEILDSEITRPEPSKTPEDAVVENISSEQNPEENFEQLKTRETIRKSRKRKNKFEAPTWGKNQLRGVVNIASVKGVKPVSYSLLREYRRKAMKPSQERIVTGGRNFDFKLLDESVPSPASNRMQLFPDGNSSLKSALAMRFAKKDYLDKINTVFTDTGTLPCREEDNQIDKQKLFLQVSQQFPVKVEMKSPRSSQDEDYSIEGSETSSSRGSEKPENLATDAVFQATVKAFDAFRNVEQKMSISSRLGLKKFTERENLSNILTKSEPTNQEVYNDEIFAPLSNQSDISFPSTSNPSIDSSTPINPSMQEKNSTNFDSPELHNIVQKHLHLLRSKSEKKRKRKHVRKIRTEDNNTPVRSLDTYGQLQEPIFDFGNQDDQDYSIFSLGDDDGYDIFNTF
jgi:DNA-directed RNA polymerase subunit M/transcription elongation factor TFIIS